MLVNCEDRLSWMMAMRTTAAAEAGSGIAVATFEHRISEIAQAEHDVSAALEYVAGHKQYAGVAAALAYDPVPQLIAASRALRTAAAGQAAAWVSDYVAEPVVTEPVAPTSPAFNSESFALAVSTQPSIASFGSHSDDGSGGSPRARCVRREDIIADPIPLAFPIFDLSRATAFVAQLIAAARARASKRRASLKKNNSRGGGGLSSDKLLSTKSAAGGLGVSARLRLDTPLGAAGSPGSDSAMSVGGSGGRAPRFVEDMPKLFIVVPRGMQGLFHDAAASWRSARDIDAAAKNVHKSADGELQVTRWHGPTLGDIAAVDPGQRMTQLTLNFHARDVSAERVEAMSDHIATAWAHLTTLRVLEVQGASDSILGLPLAGGSATLAAAVWHSLAAALSFRLSAAPSSFDHITTLQLIGLGVNDAAVELMFPADAGRGLRHLASLDLSCNDLGDGAARVFAQRVIPTGALTTLRLPLNGVSDAGAWELRSALREQHAALLLLDISLNRLTSEGSDLLRCCTVPVQQPAWTTRGHRRCDRRVRARVCAVMAAARRRRGPQLVAVLAAQVFPFLSMFDRLQPLRIVL